MSCLCQLRKLGYSDHNKFYLAQSNGRSFHCKQFYFKCKTMCIYSGFSEIDKVDILSLREEGWDFLLGPFRLWKCALNFKIFQLINQIEWQWGQRHFKQRIRTNRSYMCLWYKLQSKQSFFLLKNIAQSQCVCKSSYILFLVYHISLH